MTKAEKRALYLLAKAAGQVQRQSLVRAMSRIPRPVRDRALDNLEDMLLISSAKQPPPGHGKRGPGALVYWLTDAGREAIEHLVEQGEMRRPAA